MLSEIPVTSDRNGLVDRDRQATVPIMGKFSTSR